MLKMLSGNCWEIPNNKHQGSKSQITSTKFQIKFKPQYSMTKTEPEFVSVIELLDFGIYLPAGRLVCVLGFVFWDLTFQLFSKV